MTFRGVFPLVLILLAPAIASADNTSVTPVAKPISIEASSLQKETQIAPRFTAPQRAKLPQLGRDLITRMDAKPAKGVVPKSGDVHARELVTAAFAGASMQEVDALAFLVMMQASKSTQEDLKKAAASVKAFNAIKACNGSEKCVASIQATAEMDLASLNAARTSWEGRKDSLSELSQEKQMQLQMYQERRAKLLEMLSNAMKKLADTNSSITSNLN